MADPAHDLAESWRRNAALWTQAVRNRTIESRRLATDAAIVAAARAPAPTRVLDVGCGEGWLCRALAATGVPHVVGIDGSAPLIAAATGLGPGPFHCLGYADLVAQPDAVGAGYDLVVANFSLLDDQAGLIVAALARIAAPGARLLVQTVHPDTVPPPHVDSWRTESFATFGDGSSSTAWTPMPWFYRTRTSWLAALRPAWIATTLREPPDPRTGRPASLLIEARRADAAA